MKLSLVVATRDRPEQLARLLSSLSHQTAKRFEVIVVDQSKDYLAPEVEGIVLGYAKDFPVRYLRDLGKGLSRARNLGLMEAQGEVLGFPDDDCWYPDDLVERVLKTFEEHPDLGLLSGLYSEPGKWNPRFPKRPSKITIWNVFSCISSVTIFVRRKALSGQPWFDERVGAGTDLPAGEEMDFAIRVLKGRYRASYDPSLIVFHEIERSSTMERKSILRREQANTYVIARNAIKYRDPLLWARLILRMSKGVVLALRSDLNRQLLEARWQGFWLAFRERREALKGIEDGG